MLSLPPVLPEARRPIGAHHAAFVEPTESVELSDNNQLSQLTATLDRTDADVIEEEIRHDLTDPIFRHFIILKIAFLETSLLIHLVD